MYNIEEYGGRQIRKDDSCCYIIQFDTHQNMERWMERMRRCYTPNQLSWCVNKEALIVVM